MAREVSKEPLGMGQDIFWGLHLTFEELTLESWLGLMGSVTLGQWTYLPGLSLLSLQNGCETFCWAVGRICTECAWKVLA